MLAQLGEIIHRQSSHMARLLDDLLDVSRVTQNKIEMRKQPIAVSRILVGAVDSVRPMLEQNKQRFTEHNSYPTMMVHGDPARLQQAVSNFLANAAKYTLAGGEIGLETLQEDGQVVIRVRDNGAGIAADQIGTIFELFVQSDQTLHRSKGGMGVGLTLVRSIVEQHHGTVTAHSAGLGRGSCFEIRLPRLLETPEQSRAETDEPATSTDSGGKVVVVEDQDDNRQMLKKLIEMEGYEVITAENGPKGVAAIEQHRPDVALIDIGLPGLNGYEVAQQVRENLGNKQTFLVALTGYGQSDDVQTAFNAGFDTHVVKPLDPKRLKQLLAMRRS
jgi:two-component system CheB/CheR fusion protein